MLKEAVYFLAASFAIVTMFFTLIPVWNAFYTALVPQATTLITDTTFSTTLTTLPGNMNLIIHYSYIAILIGLGVYIALVPFREENTSYYN